MRIGDRVKDTISGFSGIVTGKTEYLNGCRQFLVKPEKLDKEGKPIEGLWIDEQTLIVLNAQVRPDPFSTAVSATAGGPDRRERAR